MGEYENRYSTSTGTVFHRARTNPTWFQIMAEPISITTSNTFYEEDWNSVINRFTFDEADIVHEDDEDCGDCAELNEFLDSLQKKCDEAV